VDYATLTYEEFDRKYLDQLPVIIEGISLCPHDVTLSNLSEFCAGKRKTRYMGGSGLAGFQWGEEVPVNSFIADLLGSQRNGPPRYMFDVRPHTHCPGLMARVKIPGLFASVLTQQRTSPWENCAWGDFAMYFTESGFRSNLHVDRGHVSLVISSCAGRKRWRVVPPKQWSAHASAFGFAKGMRGVHMKNGSGRLVIGDIFQPFESWNESSPLNDIDVEVHEGILGPGQTLYVPASAPHAADTLEHSWMVQSNEGSVLDRAELIAACKAVLEDSDDSAHSFNKEHCPDLLSNAEGLRDDLEYNDKMHDAATKRGTKTWFEAYRCTQELFCEGIAQLGLSTDTSRCMRPGLSESKFEL